MRAYSTDLRENIIMAYESGRGTLDELASTFEVDRPTVSRLLHRYRTGEGFAPKPHGGGYPASLDDKRLGLLRGRQPRTPKELNAALSDALAAVTLDDIEGWFRHCGY